MSLSRASRLALLLVAALAGCKAPPPPPPPAPTAIPTPVPASDVLSFIRSGQLWVMRWDGSEMRPLVAQAKQSFWFPSPSRSGSHFLAWMSRPDGTQDVVRIESDGTITELTNYEERALPQMKNLRLGNAPVYSPDGTRIAYSFNGNIWTMDASGFNPETIVADGNSWSPAWSPDGKRLAYVNGHGGHYDLWLTATDSRDSWQVTDFGDYTLGQPRWTSNGEKVLLTRSQKDESDIVLVVTADIDQPLVDADTITKDRLSSGASFDPDGRKLIMSSARGDGATWEIWISDVNGENQRQLTKGGGSSPAWLRPGTSTAMVSAPSRPTAVVAQPIPLATPVVSAQALSKPATPAVLSPAPTLAAAIAAATPASMPTKPVIAAPLTKPAAAVTASVAAAQASSPAAKPSAAERPVVPVSGALPALGAPVPTAAPPKAAPLRLKVKASFDPISGTLTLASLADLKSAARRIKQYAGESVLVYGPLDRSPLKARYSSNEERSQMRAKQVSEALAKAAGIDVKTVQAVPYAPPTAGSAGPANSIQIYVELK